MKILALELSTARGGVAWLDQETAWMHEWPNDRKNSGEFFATLARAVKERGRPDRVIVGLGPGSYAGTRIAIAAAVGLSAAHEAELFGLPSISAMEAEHEEYLVIGDARRHAFFCASVRDHRLAAEPELLPEEELRHRLEQLPATAPVFSSDQLPQFSRVQLRYPSARVLARLGAQESKHFVSSPLEPMYLREPHITVPKQATRVN